MHSKDVDTFNLKVFFFVNFIIVCMPAIKLANFSSSRGIDGVFILFLISLVVIFYNLFSFIGKKTITLNASLMLLLIFPILALIVFILRNLFLHSEVDFTLELIRLYGAIKVFFLIVALYLIIDKQNLRIITFIKACCIVSVFPLIVGLLQGIGLDGVDILLLEYYPRGTGQDSTELVLKFGRAFSVFDGQPNTLGFYSALIILLVFLYKPFKSLTFSGAIILLALINLYFSESRGAALSLFITLFISFLINRDVKIIIQVMILTLVIAFLSFLVGADNIDLRIVDRFINAVYLSNSDGSSIYSARMLYWDELITKLTSLRYFLMGIPSSQLVALDNLYLFIFSYLGVFFGLIYILLIVYIMASRKIMNDRRLLCILVLFFVNGMSMPTLYIARVSETLWFIALFTLITAQMKSEVNEVSYENR